jgi:3-dehydroquinate dehydratase
MQIIKEVKKRKEQIAYIQEAIDALEIEIKEFQDNCEHKLVAIRHNAKKNIYWCKLCDYSGIQR